MHRKRQEPLIDLAEALATSGVSKLVLHAWERRYGVEPAERSPTGRRFYTREQVERLRLLKACSDGGQRIGNLASLPIDALLRIEAELHARQGLADVFEAIKAIDSDRLQILLQERADGNTLEHFIHTTAIPLMREIGTMWAAGDASIAAEHMATAQIKRILGGFFDQCPQPAGDAPRLIATTPEREEHDIGALVAALLARLRGWNALFLGANLPAAEIADAAHRRDVSCVCLSALSGRKAALERHLRELRTALSPTIEIWIGGTAYASLPSLPGVTFMADLDVFLDALDRNEQQRRATD